MLATCTLKEVQMFKLSVKAKEHAPFVLPSVAEKLNK